MPSLNPRKHRPAVLLVTMLMLSVAPTGAQAVDVLDTLVRVLVPGPSFTITRSSPGREFRFQARGAVTFNDAETDVERVEGRVRIEEKRDGQSRRIEFRPDGKGGVKRIYTFNGREQPLDADGRRWLGEMVAAALRETPAGAEVRVQRMYKKGGIDAVLHEVESVTSDHARRAYIVHTLKLGPLDDKAMARLAASVQAMHSDFEKRSTLVAMADAQPLTPAQQVGILNVVAKMRSSFEQRGVLVPMAPKLAPDVVVTQAFQAALDKIVSDFEVRTVLESLAKRDKLSDAQVMLVLEGSMTIKSPFERASALKSMTKHLARGNSAQFNAYLRSAQGIKSDFERRNALVALADAATLDVASYGVLFDIIAGIHSNHEKQETLVAVAKKMPRDQDIVARYRQAAGGLNEHDRGRVEKALDRPVR